MPKQEDYTEALQAAQTQKIDPNWNEGIVLISLIIFGLHVKLFLILYSPSANS